MADYRRDFETWEQFARRLDWDEAGDELPVRATPTGPLSPFVVDLGPMFNTRADEAAVQRQENRITYLDQRDRGQH